MVFLFPIGNTVNKSHGDVNTIVSKSGPALRWNGRNEPMHPRQSFRGTAYCSLKYNRDGFAGDRSTLSWRDSGDRQRLTIKLVICCTVVGSVPYLQHELDATSAIRGCQEDLGVIAQIHCATAVLQVRVCSWWRCVSLVSWQRFPPVLRGTA